MCGDLEEDERARFKLQLSNRFLAHAQEIIAHHARVPTSAAEAGHDYLDRLFSDVLERSMTDVASAGPVHSYERLAGQSLVFDRLAGLLAAHLAYEDQPLRKVIEALTIGHAELDEIQQDLD